MRMLPKIFGDGFFDDFMESPFERYLPLISQSRTNNTPAVMKTDLQEKDGNYEISMDLPGIKKENVQIELDDGYLSISASNGKDLEEKDLDQNYLKRERYRGHYKRSFFVGEHLSTEDISAKFEDGVLYLTFPKKDPREIQNSKIIEIE